MIDVCASYTTVYNFPLNSASSVQKKRTIPLVAPLPALLEIPLRAWASPCLTNSRPNWRKLCSLSRPPRHLRSDRASRAQKFLEVSTMTRSCSRMETWVRPLIGAVESKEALPTEKTSTSGNFLPFVLFRLCLSPRFPHPQDRFQVACHDITASEYSPVRWHTRDTCSQGSP